MPRPRRVGRDVFNVDRTDRDEPSTHDQQPPALKDLLPPLKAVPTLGEQAPAEGSGGEDGPTTVTAATTDREGSTDDVTKHDVRSARPRGAGGKAPAPARPGGITAVPARVPGGLYEAALPLVRGVGRPSWGQLVAWTCQDHPDQVRAAVQRLIADAPGSRRPRGQNRPGAAGVQVTARVSADELQVMESVRRACEERADGGPPTRTVVLIAALTVAVELAEG